MLDACTALTEIKKQNEKLDRKNLFENERMWLFPLQAIILNVHTCRRL